MASDEIGELRARLERLEAEVERLRHDAEPRTSYSPTTGPPPIIQRPPTEPSWLGIEHVPVRPTTPQREPSPPVTPKVPKPEKVDTEFKFGSQVLPRVGMVVIVLGILYLVAYAIQTGAITMFWQFMGELGLCAALIGIGLWKLNEKEDFGHVLVGGGSCGLYLSFAGAHVYKDLLNGETLVVLFLLLSLANLAFSWWRSSKTFWAIGLVGGLVGAALPLDRDAFASTFLLAGLIVVAASVLAAKNAWLRAIEVLWIVSSLYALFIAIHAVGLEAIRAPGAIAVFYGFSLVPLFAHALRFESSDFDSEGWFEATAIGLTGIATLAFGGQVSPVPHSVSVVSLSLVVGALAWGVRKRANSGAVTAAAIGVCTIIAPMGFKAFTAGLTYIALTVLFSLPAYLGKKRVERPGALFSAGFVALAVLAYAIAMDGSVLSNARELAMLGALAVGVANVAFIAGKLEDKMEAAVTIGSVLLYAPLARASYLTAPTWGVYSVLFPTALYAIVLSVVSIRAKWSGPAVVALTLTSISTLLYWVDVSTLDRQENVGREIVALALTTAALVISSIGAGRGRPEQSGIALLAAVLGGFTVVPMLSTALVGMQEAAALVLSMSAYALVLTAVAWRSKWNGYSLVGMAVATLGVATYFSAASSDFVSPSAQIPLVLMLAVALLASAGFAGDAGRKSRSAWVVSSLIGSYVVSRLFFLVLTLPAIGMQEPSAAQTSLAAYACVLALGSIRTKQPDFAYVGAAVTLVSVAYYWVLLLDADTMAREGQIIATAVAAAAALLCTIGAGTTAEERKKLSVLGAIVGWATLARTIGLLLFATGMEYQASVTIAWSLYAGLLLTTGFVYNTKQLRISSLVLFGVTLVKVFLVDLAALEAYIRVFLLIVVGGLLVLFGYVYVRRRALPDDSPR